MASSPLAAVSSCRLRAWDGEGGSKAGCIFSLWRRPGQHQVLLWPAQLLLSCWFTLQSSSWADLLGSHRLPRVSCSAGHTLTGVMGRWIVEAWGHQSGPPVRLLYPDTHPTDHFRSCSLVEESAQSQSPGKPKLPPVAVFRPRQQN